MASHRGPRNLLAMMLRFAIEMIQGRVGPLPMLHGIIRCELIRDHNKLEDKSVGKLGRLVPKSPLRQQRPGPSTKQLKRVQHAL